MILVRSPLRISFVGGGSDLPAFYRAGTPGQVVSMTIAESVYVSVQPSHDGRTRLHYRHIEDVATPGDLRHDRARACLGVRQGLEVHSIADVPAGSGLGSSSAFTVALLAALTPRLAPHELAAAACVAEIDVCGHAIGTQDQYAAAFGGLRHYTFHADDTVTSRPLHPSWSALAPRLWLIPVGGAHDAGALCAAQAADAASVARLAHLAGLAADFAGLLEVGDYQACGEALDEAWQVKRCHPGVTTDAIDDVVARAKRAGAIGCKLLGAGGAGFVLAWLKADHASYLRRVFPDARPVRPYHAGAQVVYQAELMPTLPLLEASGLYVGGPL